MSRLSKLPLLFLSVTW